MDVYLILKEQYWTEPLLIVGAEKAPGRWNSSRLGILYTSSSPTFALLEIVVHVPSVRYGELPAMCLFKLSVPDECVRWAEPNQLLDNWD